ncbi:SDR family oxidoreductase [Streptomyces sp. NPDC060187]|uniref:SDR family oxidoreductase n=1 Tax=Streptomyces sp. NPDC060187 TaxID=3347067 RepID=UPI00364FD234
MTETYGLVIDDEASIEQMSRSTVRLLAAEFTAGVQHHVGLSVVGVDRLRERGYFRALYAHEAMIRQSGMPYSIIRATNIFECVFDTADAGTEDWIVWVTPVQVRPVAGTEVATLLAHTAASKPVLGVREIAGPDQFRLDTFVRAALTSTDNEPRRVFTDSRSLYFGASLRHSDLLPGEEAYIARMHYSNWLKGQSVLTSPERADRVEILDQP